MPQTQIHRLSNGLTIAGECLPEKQAAAWTLLVPAGSANEPAGKEGITSVLEGLCYLGAGPRDSRQFSDALDDLGIARSGGAGVEYTTFGGATLGLYLRDALQLYADVVRRPHLPADEWEAQRDLALQGLKSLEDAPARKMMVQLRRSWFTHGHGRSGVGTKEGLESLTLKDLRADHGRRYLPEGAILSLAGHFNFEAMVERAEELFADWTGFATPLEEPHVVAEPFYIHLEKETAQQQIGVAYQGVPSTDADFYSFRVANSILSGGMGARLFTEVREKRGLVYSVSASADSYRGIGYTVAYAGTTPERAQETLEVLLHELSRMADGVTDDEVERAKTGMLAAVVMQEESSRARAGGVARDLWMLGRVRSLEEISERINAVTPATIREYYQRCPPCRYSVITLGPRPLELPEQ